MKAPVNNPYFSLGASIACEHFGMTQGDLVEKSATLSELYKQSSFHRYVSSVVQGAFVLKGEGGSKARYAVKAAFERLANGDERALDICSDIIDSYLDCDAHGQEKSASAGALAGILAKLGLTSGRGAMAGLVYGAGLGGAGLGTMGWALNRNVHQDRADNEVLQAQIDAYNRMTNEIRRKLKDRGVEVDEQDERDIREITGAERVVGRRVS